MRKQFELDWLPYAISIGLTKEQFYSCTMRQLNAYIEANKMKLVEKDLFDYRQGQYFLSALQTALDGAFNGKKAKTTYIDKPFLSDIQDSIISKEKDRPLTEEEKQRQIDLFVLKRQIAKKNYDLARQIDGK